LFFSEIFLEMYHFYFKLIFFNFCFFYRFIQILNEKYKRIEIGKLEIFRKRMNENFLFEIFRVLIFFGTEITTSNPTLRRRSCLEWEMAGEVGVDNGSATSTAKRSSLRQGRFERCGQNRHQGTSASQWIKMNTS